MKLPLQKRVENYNKKRNSLKNLKIFKMDKFSKIPVKTKPRK